MTATALSARALRNRRAHGCRGGPPPRRPGSLPPSSWRPGDPAHWQEQSALQRLRGYMVRIVAIAQLVASVAYLQHRARHTIGVFPESRVFYWFALQIAFFAYEVFVTLFAVMQLLEHWTLANRNAVRFDAIPARLVAPADEGENDLPARLSAPVDPAGHDHYPTVDVIIPCYKEDVRLVRPTVRSALGMIYPQARINVFLCDDGRDPLKKKMVAALRAVHPNVHYVTRPDNAHAKPGNVNYTLERTNGRLVAQLDADFLARPDLLLRLLPYYYVWNETAGRYEFNDNVCAVQTPQHYRNISPRDADPFDQRNILFYNGSLVSKDWFNMATMVGTGNLLNRTALRKAGNFPYHSFGDDTALSVMFHGLGLRTYYVNQTVANGLVPSSLRGNLAQRARWYATDSQIMFSRHGPLTQKGLTLVQRIMYLNMWLHKLQAIMNIFVDVVIVLVLVAGFSVVDVRDARGFLWYLLPHILVGSLFRLSLCLAIPGAFKSTAGFEVFESTFKYTTAKGVLQVLFKRKSLRWKVAEKVMNDDDESDEGDKSSSAPDETHSTTPASTDNLERAESSESANNTSTKGNVSLSIEPAAAAAGAITRPGVAVTSARAPLPRGGRPSDTAPRASSNVDDVAASPARESTPANEDLANDSYAKFVLKNIKRCWYNVLMLAVFSFAMTWAIVRPPDFAQMNFVAVVNGVRGRYEYSKIIPLSLSFALALGHASAHLLALAMCFKREYVKPYSVADPINDRVDHFVERDDGSAYVPGSFVNLFAWFRSLVLLGAVAFLVIMTLRQQSNFVPLPL